MSRSFVFDRFFIENGKRVPDGEGGLVDAQVAIDRIAVLSAEITTLTARLKDAQRIVAEYRRLV